MKRINPLAIRRRQQGITLVLISLIMLILIGMGAFAMDLSHQVLNKARLQNAVDSAALASALVADQTSDVELAEQAAIDALKSFVTPQEDLPDGVVFGNQELVYSKENISVTFSSDKQKFEEYGEDDSFVFGNDSDIYVRVAVSDVSLTQYLSHIFGGVKNVSASAVAGPSAPIATTCNISPIGMCGDVTKASQAWGYIPEGKPDYDAKLHNDPSTIHILKPSSHKDGGIGPGNFHLLDFGQGKNTVEELLAGASNACISVGQEIVTETGKGIGPVRDGLNTRFGIFGNGANDGFITETTESGEEIQIEIKADKYLKESNVNGDNYQQIFADPTSDKAFYYSEYHSALNACESQNGCTDSYYNADGSEGRRVLRVPIVNCDTPPDDPNTGKSTLPIIGLGCFFLTQKIPEPGKPESGDKTGGGNESEIFGQFLDDCSVKNASTGINPTNSIGPYKIQLYKDPLSGDS